MHETIEFRIPEDRADRFLRPTDGVRLASSVRKLTLGASDPLMSKIASIERQLRAQGDFFFLGWHILRRYTDEEFQAARALKMIIRHVFEPAAEECGTVYDQSQACPYCGSGGRQVSGLVLEARSLPKRGNLAIAKTIAGEVVVTQRFVDLFRANKLRGAEFEVVRQKRRSAHAIPGWYELMVTSTRLAIAAPTRAGVEPFDDGCQSRTHKGGSYNGSALAGSWCDRRGDYRCPLGHTIGLNLLSELTVEHNGFRDCDIAATKRCVGVRRGLLRPQPLLVVSPIFRELVIRHGLKGMDFEVAHLV